MDRKKLKAAVVSGNDPDGTGVMRLFLETLEREGVETADISCSVSGPGDILREVKAFRPDILVTVDLQGFEQCTLTDNLSYNLLGCKQIHLLLHDRLRNERCLDKQLSIAMFFYCAGHDHYEYLCNRYPNLPYLKELSGWQAGRNAGAAEQNAELLYGVFREVLRECRIREL